MKIFLLTLLTLTCGLASSVYIADQTGFLASGLKAIGLSKAASEASAQAVSSGYCQVNDFDAARVSCKDGNVVGFFPNSFGNEQLPILFTARYCNHQHHIALTRGAVSCIYRDNRIAMDGASK